jgi:hypothetical protein
MTKKLVPAAALFVLIAAFSVFSQDKAAEYAGSWKLDLAKSEMGERSRVESMDMTVTQTKDELTVERKAKMAEGQGGGMGRGGMGGGAGKMAYSLTGKETTAAFGMGGEAKLSAKIEKGGKLTLSQERNIETQMGAMTIKTVEKWELSEDGKTLTISSSTETPRGARNQKMVFAKQ